MILKIVVLAVIQGIAELLPISSSAHVIVAEKLMGLDPSAPEMTFLLVMLHTGTMFSVLIYFWPRWKVLFQKGAFHFLKMITLATGATGVIGFGLKVFIEEVLLASTPHAEVENLFRNLSAVGVALFSVGILIVIAGLKKKPAVEAPLNTKNAILIGMVQGLCLPFRGFSRSGATISAALLRGISRELAEDFSFALAVVLTPVAILHQAHRLLKANAHLLDAGHSVTALLSDGFIGMIFSAIAGFIALRWLSSWLEKGRWAYFGYYCIVAATLIFIFFR